MVIDDLGGCDGVDLEIGGEGRLILPCKLVSQRGHVHGRDRPWRLFERAHKLSRAFLEGLRCDHQD